MKVMIIGSIYVGMVVVCEILICYLEMVVMIYEWNDNVLFVLSGIYLYLMGVI